MAAAVLQTTGRGSVCRRIAITSLLAILAGCSGPVDEAGRAAAANVGPAAGEIPFRAAEADVGAVIYRRACSACHQNGLVGAPKLGDRGAWEPRIARGVDTLVEHALHGFQGESGIMPPRGGHSYLEDAEVSAAVDFMVQAARRSAPAPGAR